MPTWARIRTMKVLRVVPVITVADVSSARTRYIDLLGMTEVMNHGWIVTLAATADPSGPQLSLMTRDLTAVLNPDISIEVDDVDASYRVARESGLEIVHELTDEDWGVRRYFFRDATCERVVNVLSHRRQAL